MKIGVAQYQSVQGEVAQNIKRHQQFIEVAATQGADLLVFPELSLTGYEPSLAKSLAITLDDKCLEVLQDLSNQYNMRIGVGVPTHEEAGICITLLILQPFQERRTYSKYYLHPDEEPFFVRGKAFPVMFVHQTAVAFAICYELLVPAHPQQANEHQAKVYVASVAKSAKGVEKAVVTLADTAQRYGMTVLMANGLGPSDDFVSAGNSAVWNSKGELLAQLNETNEGLLLIDTTTDEVIISYLDEEAIS
ncbi:MAG: carbon-nitrogen hydrolase family protein [Spirosomataceae bacterium]